MQFLILETTACFKECWLQSQGYVGYVTCSEQAKSWSMNCRVLCSQTIELWVKGRCKGRTHMRNQWLFWLQSVSRSLVHSACWGKQVAYYLLEKKYLSDRRSNHERTRWMVGPPEVSRRWVVTPMFFSKKTEHIGERKKLDREVLAFEGCERHLQAFTLWYCQRKHRHIPDPETAQNIA